MRFRKSIKLLPGVRLNMSNSGLSWTVGRPGASVNFKSGRSARTTVGLPGTGLSWTSGGRRTSSDRPQPEWRLLRGLFRVLSWLFWLTAAMVFSMAAYHWFIAR